MMLQPSAYVSVKTEDAEDMKRVRESEECGEGTDADDSKRQRKGERKVCFKSGWATTWKQ